MNVKKTLLHLETLVLMQTKKGSKLEEKEKIANQQKMRMKEMIKNF